MLTAEELWAAFFAGVAGSRVKIVLMMVFWGRDDVTFSKLVNEELRVAPEKKQRPTIPSSVLFYLPFHILCIFMQHLRMKIWSLENDFVRYQKSLAL